MNKAENLAPLVVSVPEAAKMLDVCIKTVYDLAATEGFPAVRLGKRIVIPYEGLKEWINRQAGGETA